VPTLADGTDRLPLRLRHRDIAELVHAIGESLDRERKAEADVDVESDRRIYV
jgi:hypothetical protein